MVGAIMAQRSHLRPSTAWFIACGALLAVHAAVSLFLPNGGLLRVFGNVVQSLLLFACYLFTVLNQVRAGRTSRYWTLLSVGFALWLLQQFLWSYYEVIVRTEIPPMFWGDIILFFHVVPVFMAFCIQPQFGEKADRLRMQISDCLVMLVWWTYLYVVFVMAWQYFLPDQSNYDFNFNVIYGIANLSLVAAAVISWWRSTGDWRTFYAHWVGAAVLYAVASYLASSAIDQGSYYTGCLYDLPLVASYGWFAGIGLLGRELPLQPAMAPAGKDSQNVWGARLILATIVAMLFIVVFISGGAGIAIRMFRVNLSIVAAALMGLIFLLRRGRLDRVAAVLKSLTGAHTPHPARH